MVSENRYHYVALRRGYLERRQSPLAAALPTTKVVPVRPHAKTPPIPTSKPTLKPTVKPTVTPITTPIVTPIVTPAKPTVTVATTLVPVKSLSLLSSSLDTPVTSVTPSSILGPLIPSVTSTRPPSATHRAITSPITGPKASSSSRPTATPSASGGISTGAVVGGIIGGFATLGLIGAAVFLFLRRAKEKNERNERAFDASKFRRSATILDDPTDKRSEPQPPISIEQLAHQYETSLVPNPYPNSHYPAEQAHYGSPYNPTSYGPVHSTEMYGAQTTYGQYPLQPNVYTAYGNHHGYPQPQYQYGPHQDGTYLGSLSPSVHRSESPDAAQVNLALPNPFTAAHSSASEIHYSSDGPPTSTMRDLPRSASSLPNRLELTGDNDAPPVYEVTGDFARYKADTKPKPISSESNGFRGAAASDTSDSMPRAASTSALASTSVASPSNQLLTCDKSLPSRPASRATVYDINDAYGGM